MRSALVLISWLFIAHAAPPAAAEGVRVAPIHLDMRETRRTTSFRVDNSSSAPRAFEIDALVWTQRDGRDVLSPGAPLLVSPSVFEVAAGHAQTVRIAYRNERLPTTEESYRIILRELAPHAAGHGAVSLRLEISLPLFVSAERAPAPALTLEQGENGAAIIANRGEGHAQLASVRGPDHRAFAMPRYLLAGSAAAAQLTASLVHVRYARADRSGFVDETLHHAPAARLRP